MKILRKLSAVLLTAALLLSPLTACERPTAPESADDPQTTDSRTAESPTGTLSSSDSEDGQPPESESTPTTDAPRPLPEPVRRAEDAGILPGTDAGETTEKLNALLSQGGTVLVDVPGIYDLDDTLLIGSDTALVCSSGVSFRQTRDVGGIILNRGALTREYDSNIVIDGLNVICDGHWSSSSTYVPGLRGKIALYYTRDSVIRNVTCSDIPKETYFIHVSRFDGLLIEDCVISGFKDGIHVSTGDGLTVRGCRISTKDDPIALNAHDYVNGCPELGDIRNVLIENCVNASDNRGFITENFPSYSSYSGNRGMLLLGGGWLDWAEGNRYRRSDAVVSNGYVYQLDAPDSGANAGQEYTSSSAPTHSAGSVTYPDGLTWVWKGTAVYGARVENLTVRDYRVETTHEVLFYSYCDNDVFSRSVYPGAYAPPHTNLTFENVTVDPEYWFHSFLYYRYPADEVTIRNCDFTGRAVLRVNTDKPWDTVRGNNRFNVRVTDSTFVLGNNPQGSPYASPMYTVQSYCNGSYSGDTPVIFQLAASGNACPQAMGNSISDSSARVIRSGNGCDLLPAIE